MRILLTTFTYPPNADGVAAASAVLANGLAARGHTVTVATEYHSQRAPNTSNANPRVEQFKISGTGNFRTPVVGETQAYQEFVRNFECDVIVFECWDIWSTYLIRPLLKDLKAKKVLVSHGYAAHLWVPYCRFPWGLGSWVGGFPLVAKMPFDLRRYDHVVFLSERAAWDRFLDHWIAKKTRFKRCSIIPNGAFMKEFEETSVNFRAEYGIGPGPIFLCVANYCDRKNQLMALRAFREGSFDDATLVFIGSQFNDYSRSLEAEDAELKRRFIAGKVLFLEKVSRQMTCAAYKAADIFVLSAKAETQPIVLLEAMASKTPFISTDTGCVAELPGGLVARSETEMTARMKELVASAEKRQKLGREGFEACKTTYDWQRVIEQYERLLLSLAT